MCTGIAGLGVSEEKQAEVRSVIWEILSTLPFCRILSKRFNPSLSIKVVSDVVIALVAGAGERHGIVAISGTGFVVYGETIKGQKIKGGGWGYLLDEGSGYEIGRIALREILKAYDVSGKTTLLAQKILNACSGIFILFMRVTGWHGQILSLYVFNRDCLSVPHLMHMGCCHLWL